MRPSPVDLSADRWASRLSITILDGSLQTVPIDGGIVGILLDVDGSIAGAFVHGSSSSLMTLQDASTEWIAEHGPLFAAETRLAMPPG